jgi:hypothetical protein
MKTIRLDTKSRRILMPLEVKRQDTSEPSKSMDTGLLAQGHLCRRIGLVKYAIRDGPVKYAAIVHRR